MGEGVGALTRKLACEAGMRKKDAKCECTDGEESLQSVRPSSGSTAGSPLEAGRRWMSGPTLQASCKAKASASMG